MPRQVGTLPEGSWASEGGGGHSAAGKQTFNFIKGAKFLKVSLASREIKRKQVERVFSVCQIDSHPLPRHKHTHKHTHTARIGGVGACVGVDRHKFVLLSQLRAVQVPKGLWAGRQHGSKADRQPGDEAWRRCEIHVLDTEAKQSWLS